MEDNNHNAQTIINVAGDYVQYKHVDYEIGNVEQGGIGIQIVQGKSAGTVPSTTAKQANGKTVESKKSSFFLATPTFIYRYLNAKPEDAKRLPLLFQHLTKEYREGKSYLDPETAPDAFYSLFTGERSDTVVTWTGTQQDLYFFVKRMVKREIIRLPESWSIWKITENHFSDRNGNPYLNLRHQHPPKIAVEAIESLIDILDPAATTSDDLAKLRTNIG